jgi:hypothetical protein
MRPIMVYLAKCSIRNTMDADDETRRRRQHLIGRTLGAFSERVLGTGKAVGSVHESLKYQKDTFEDDAHVR